VPGVIFALLLGMGPHMGKTGADDLLPAVRFLGAMQIVLALGIGAGVYAIGKAICDAKEGSRLAEVARWLLLAAVPSGLLSAVTNFITTDLISAPLLWVVPLSIYLLTFVIAFSEHGRRIVPGAEWLAPAAVTDGARPWAVPLPGAAPPSAPPFPIPPTRSHRCSCAPRPP